MVDTDTSPVTSALHMDRSSPIGNSLSDLDNRRALHVKIKNDSDEPIIVEVAADTTQSATSLYNGVTAVASGIETTVIIYTVPVGKTFYFGNTIFSGTNIAQYKVYRNSSVLAVMRTYFGGALNGMVDFLAGASAGVKIDSGETISITAEHFRLGTGDFDCTINGILLG